MSACLTQSLACAMPVLRGVPIFYPAETDASAASASQPELDACKQCVDFDYLQKTPCSQSHAPLEHGIQQRQSVQRLSWTCAAAHMCFACMRLILLLVCARVCSCQHPACCCRRSAWPPHPCSFVSCTCSSFCAGSSFARLRPVCCDATTHSWFVASACV